MSAYRQGEDNSDLSMQEVLEIKDRLGCITEQLGQIKDQGQTLGLGLEQIEERNDAVENLERDVLDVKNVLEAIENVLTDTEPIKPIEDQGTVAPVGQLQKKSQKKEEKLCILL